MPWINEVQIRTSSPHFKIPGEFSEDGNEMSLNLLGGRSPMVNTIPLTCLELKILEISAISAVLVGLSQ